MKLIMISSKTCSLCNAYERYIIQNGLNIDIRYIGGFSSYPSFVIQKDDEMQKLYGISLHGAIEQFNNEYIKEVKECH